MLEQNISHNDGTGFSRVVLTIVDVLIGALIFLLPFIMGGREAWGHWFLITVSLSLGVSWAVYAAVQGSRYSVSWLEVFLIAGLSIAWFQVQPQTPETMSRVSPEYAQLYAYSTGSTRTPYIESC